MNVHYKSYGCRTYMYDRTWENSFFLQNTRSISLYLLFPSADLLEARKSRVSFANADKMAGTEILSIDLRLCMYIYKKFLVLSFLPFENPPALPVPWRYRSLISFYPYISKFVLCSERKMSLLFGRSEMEDITSWIASPSSPSFFQGDDILGNIIGKHFTTSGFSKQKSNASNSNILKWDKNSI